MMHGHEKMGATPTFDVVMLYLRVGAVSIFFPFPNTRRFALTQAESVRIGWNQWNTPI